MMEQEDLLDVWRKWNKSVRDYTFSSRKTCSQIDMIWGSKSLSILTNKINILPKICADHNHVLWSIKSQQSKRNNWRRNESILNFKENIDFLAEEARQFFKLILDNEVPLETVWDANKTVLRGDLIKLSHIKKKNEGGNYRI